MKTPVVFGIPCAYGKSYIGQTGKAIEIRIKEQERDVEYRRVKKSVGAENVENRRHKIQ